MATVKNYALEGLCCPNCAAEIEDMTAKVEGVKKSTVDFASKRITVDFDCDEREIFRALTDIASEVDEDIVVRTM
ncbi:MAG: cation transporter [Synergistaceae bacterium]|jgi:Cd2+/Zn2+-exporting ATPase|nr:cation transporter [Synergistaceae bacterium]